MTDKDKFFAISRGCVLFVKIALEFPIVMIVKWVADELSGSPYVHNTWCRVIFYQYDESIQFEGFRVGGGIFIPEQDFVDYTLIGNRDSECDEDCFIGVEASPSWTESVNLADGGGEFCDMDCDGGTCMIAMEEGDSGGVEHGWLFYPGLFFFLIKAMNLYQKALDAAFAADSPASQTAILLAAFSANVVMMPISQMHDTSASPNHLITMQSDTRNNLTIWTGLFTVMWFVYTVGRTFHLMMGSKACEGYAQGAEVTANACSCCTLVIHWILIIMAGNWSLVVFIHWSLSVNYPEFDVGAHLTAIKVLLFLVWWMDIGEAGLNVAKSCLDNN